VAPTHLHVQSEVFTVHGLLKNYYPFLSAYGFSLLTLLPVHDELYRVQCASNRLDDVCFNLRRKKGGAFSNAKDLEKLIGRICEHGRADVAQADHLSKRRLQVYRIFEMQYPCAMIGRAGSGILSRDLVIITSLEDLLFLLCSVFERLLRDDFGQEPGQTTRTGWGLNLGSES